MHEFRLNDSLAHSRVSFIKKRDWILFRQLLTLYEWMIEWLTGAVNSMYYSADNNNS